jgi:sugar lactone lactonase YvrE
MISRGFGVIGVLALQWALSTSAETLWSAKPFSSEGFTRGIEGPACDRNGVVFCVGFGDPRNIARVTPDGRAERFVALPEGSAGNGIRFDRSGRMYVADYTAHKIHRIDPATREVVQVVHEPRMNQPND